MAGSPSKRYGIAYMNKASFPEIVKAATAEGKDIGEYLLTCHEEHQRRQVEKAK